MFKKYRPKKSGYPWKRSRNSRLSRNNNTHYRSDS
jgi:hypothetical protein